MTDLLTAAKEAEEQMMRVMNVASITEVYLGREFRQSWVKLSRAIREQSSARKVKPSDITKARKSSGLSQTKFSAKLNIHRNTLKRYESGEWPIPTDCAMTFLAIYGKGEA